MAVCQAMMCCLDYRHRRQASSHILIFIGVEKGFQVAIVDESAQCQHIHRPRTILIQMRHLTAHRRMNPRPLIKSM
jgi:hypothetical protein